MFEKEIVVTGMSAISSIGIGVTEFWRNILQCKSGVSKISKFDTSVFSIHIGGEIKNFNTEEYLDSGIVKNIGRASQYAIIAADLAIKDANLQLGSIVKDRIGACFGTTMGEIQEEENISEVWVKDSIEQIDHSKFLKYPSCTIPRNVAKHFGIEGPSVMIPTACAAGNYSFGYAAELIAQNEVDIMIAGGVDPFSRMAFTGFHRLKSLAPERCQPFDGARKGVVIGEGAGVLVLESLEHAQKRGASILAKFSGYGLGCDSYHMTRPHPNGLGGINAINNALRNSNLNINDVDYISAHGTATKENDKIETLIIKNVFKDLAKSIPISSIKSMIGHAMGAASGLEAVACICALRDGILPATINYEQPDPECDLDFIPNEPREKDIKNVLSNAFAFGGNTCSVIFSKI